MDFDWKETLRAVAPGLATALGGPGVGLAVKLIGEKLLGNPNATPDEVQQALSRGLDGGQIVALKEAENQLTIELARIDQASQVAAIDDTKSARQQTVDLAKEDSGIAWAAPVISTIIVAGFFIVVALLFYVERTWDERTAGLLNNLFGALTISFGQVCNYWLGSSAGSRRSSDTVRKIAEQATK